MNVVSTDIEGVCVIEPQLFQDARGFFMESFHAKNYRRLGLPDRYVQDNHSRSVKGTLRGLHYQLPRPQGKLVRVVCGMVFDVAVDLRRSSPTFGQWTGVWLSDSNHLQLYIPPGCAHGFCVASDSADLLYKCTEFYCKECEHTIAWNDPLLAIDWPLDTPILSDKDRQGRPFAEAPYYDV